MEMMELYNQARSVPDEAKKAIGAGRLKGFTDINPMWRIKRLTEMFGACGIGWWYEITDKRIVEDTITNQKSAFVDILLFYKHPQSGEVSRGIPGTGGSSFVAQEKSGAYLSDEAFKMALTDAISVSAKALGVGADVYYANDRSKYSGKGEDGNPKDGNPVAAAQFKCADCGAVLKPVKVGQKTYGVREWAAGTEKEFGRPLCTECRKKAKEAKAAE